MTRKRLLTSAAALAGVGIAGVWLMAHRPVKLLPYGSIRIASTASWKEMLVRSMPIIPPKDYFWTSQGEILHPEKNADGSTTVVRDRLTPSANLRRDTASSARIPAGGYFLQPTPDGSGLLYWTVNTAHIHDMDVHLLTADGKSDRLLPALWMQNLVWMPDGKHWLVSRADGDFLNSLDGNPFRKLDTRSLRAWTPCILGADTQSRALSTFGNEWFEAPDPARKPSVITIPPCCCWSSILPRLGTIPASGTFRRLLGRFAARSCSPRTETAFCGSWISRSRSSPTGQPGCG